MRIESWVRAFPASSRARTMLRYAMSIASVVLAGVVRLALNPLLGDQHAYTWFFAALAFTAWYSGFGPTVLAVVIAYLMADWLFVTPHYELDFQNYSLQDVAGMAGFVCSGLAIALTTKALHAARRRAEARQRELAQQILERERMAAELREAKGQLEAQAARLEQTVDERTAHLVITIHSLEGVCYHLAHDLRAPLRAINSYADILQADCSASWDAPAREHLGRIRAAAERMDTLLCDLMDYGRIGHEQFLWQSVDLEAELARVCSELSGPIQASQAELRWERPLPRVWGNRGLVRQVLMQLVSNGLKFVAPGVRPRLQVHAQAEQSTVRLWVSDNGIGIPAKYHDKVFGIFQRLCPGENYPGTGIGLAIAAKAAQRMGGRVGLESEPGKGSRFWVDFLRPPPAPPGKAGLLQPACMMPARVGPRRADTFASD